MAIDPKHTRPFPTNDTAGYGITNVQPQQGPFIGDIKDTQLVRADPHTVLQAVTHTPRNLTAAEQVDQLEMIRAAMALSEKMALKDLRTSILRPEAMSKGVITNILGRQVLIPGPTALPSDVIHFADTLITPAMRAESIGKPAADDTKPTIIAPEPSVKLVKTGDVLAATLQPDPDHVADTQPAQAKPTQPAADADPATLDPAAHIAAIAADAGHTRASRLQEMVRFAGELTDEHIFELCKSMKDVCEAMADHIKQDRSIDAVHIGHEQIPALNELQKHVLGIIQIMKTQVPAKDWAKENKAVAGVIGESLSDLLTVYSNRVTIGMTPEQKDLYVDLSNAVLDGLFVKPRFQDRSGGGGQDGNSGMAL